MTKAEQTLVSVVIPFRDAGRFVAEAIESVYTQSYSNWEILLVDDGSRDAGSAIARDYAARCPERVRLFEHPGHEHRGASASRNVGITRARGELVALLDADDVWAPCKLEEQVGAMRAHAEAGVVYGTREVWKSWQGSPSVESGDQVVVQGIPADTIYRPPALFLLMFGARRATVPSCSDLLFRRAGALRVRGFEEAFRGMYDDQAFLAKLFLEEWVFVSSRCWTRYRQHPASCVATWAAQGSGSREWEALLTWMDGYVRAHPTAGPTVRRAARRALREFRHPLLSRILMLPRAISRRFTDSRVNARAHAAI